MALKFKIAFVGLIVSLTSFSQEINWIEFDNLSDSLRKEKKEILVFVYADWCKYCKIQENTIFKDVEVIEHLNNHFYCLKLNADYKKDIVFMGKSYRRLSNDYHELALFLAKENQKISFPTTIIFDSNLELKSRLIGIALKEGFIK